MGRRISSVCACKMGLINRRLYKAHYDDTHMGVITGFVNIFSLIHLHEILLWNIVALSDNTFTTNTTRYRYVVHDGNMLRSLCSSSGSEARRDSQTFWECVAAFTIVVYLNTRFWLKLSSVDSQPHTRFMAGDYFAKTSQNLSNMLWVLFFLCANRILTFLCLA